MVQSPSWEANWFAGSQEISRISRNPNVHYHTHNRPPPVSILGHPNPVHIPTSHLLEIRPNTIRPSTPRSPQWSLSFRFPRQDPIHPTLLTHTRYMPSPSHSSRFYHPHNIGWGFPHYCEHMEEIISISHECTYVELIATGWLKWLHTVEPLRVKQSRYRAGGAQSVPGSYDSQILWQRHRMVLGCQPYAPVAFTPRKYSWFSFLSTAESTLGPQCDRKDYVNEIFQWHHLESNQRPSYL